MRHLPFIALAILTILPSCMQRKDAGKQAREDYARSLGDSIALIQQEIDSCNSQIAILRDKSGAMMHDFTTVANPREVGSYILPTDFADKYPPKQTAVVARIDDMGRFELIAALEGPKTFNQITVQSSDVSASTDVVPNDQALNYRTSSMTTVSFTGEAADKVGALISDNQLNPLTVVYQQGGAVSNWKIPTLYAGEIAATYRLYQTMSELNRLERRVPMLHEKINLLRIHLDKRDDKSTPGADDNPAETPAETPVAGN